MVRRWRRHQHHRTPAFLSNRRSQQGNAAISTTNRVYPDVSADADPKTGVSIYDSYDFRGHNPWFQYGGTSLACPLWAGMIAVADQGLRESRGSDP